MRVIQAHICNIIRPHCTASKVPFLQTWCRTRFCNLFRWRSPKLRPGMSLPWGFRTKKLKLTKSRTIHLTKKCQISFVSLTLLTCHHRAFSRCFHSRTLSALDQSPWKWRTPQPSGTSSSGPSPDCAWPRWHWAWTCQGRAWGAPLCYSNLCPTWKNRYGWISVKWKRLTCPQEDVQAGGFLETPVGHHLQPNDKYKDKVIQMPNVCYIC